MYCVNCRTKLNPEARFCPRCGAPVQKIVEKDYEVPSEVPSEVPRNVEKPKRRKKHYSTLGIVAAVICGAAILLPLPIIISFPMCLCSTILAIIDLCIQGENKYKADDICAIIIGIIYCFILFGGN